MRDAMVREPLALEASASAREAGERLSDPDVRAVLVCDGGRLVGVVTRKTLVREVVARGRDPERTPLHEIAEPPRYTLAADTDLEVAFHELEARDLERVPVTDADGRLVGVLSRAVVQRRLAEDEPPAEDDESLSAA
ncbi:MAG TPA: CBS domain-containing protein [Gaiellaceae bacterium]|nr:CBS domain-containing protein [Gaiellaceae bacterium]